MIPQQYITEWSEFSPWKTNEQVEQDLVICRSMIELFSDDFIAKRLAFRGGTAIHKLYVHPQQRYSEDIDLVQISEGSFGPIIDKIRELLNFMGKPRIDQKDRNSTMIFKFESEIQPVQIYLILHTFTPLQKHKTLQRFKLSLSYDSILLKLNFIFKMTLKTSKNTYDVKVT